MTVITITTQAKCKHCKFAKRHNPIKKDGSYSFRAKYQCSNLESGRTNITQNELVCDKWQLY